MTLTTRPLRSDGTMLRATGISKSYQQHGTALPVLHQVDLHVDPGELVVLRGRSGSGKSTLLNVLGLLTRPDQGSLLIDGQETAGLGERDTARIRAGTLGFVFQSFNLLPHLTALENVTLPAAGPERTAAVRGRELLERVGLAERADHLPSQLSGGEQQRVALARALVNRPKVVLADEPTGNLDEENEQLVLEQLRAIAAEGCAVLVVSHADTVAQIADRRLELTKGRLGTPAPAPDTTEPAAQGEQQ